MAITFAVETERLCKHYGAARVLHDVTLRVPIGALYGFLGPNGAGKTTTIRILLGLLRASSGTASVLGCDVWRDGPRLRADVGYLPGDVRFHDYLTGRKMLAFLDRARGGRGAGEIERLARVFDLDLTKKIRRYSRGMKQKLGLIAAMMHRPALLILDEPTTALDPLVRVTLFAELRGAANEGRTVLFSSHTLSEVEELCDQVAILRGGRLIEHGSIAELRNRALRGVELTFEGAPPPIESLPRGLIVSVQRERYWKCTWVGPVPPLLAWLAKQSVHDMVVAPPNLEDLFLGYYGANGNGAAQPAALPSAALQEAAR